MLNIKSFNWYQMIRYQRMSIASFLQRLFKGKFGFWVLFLLAVLSDFTGLTKAAGITTTLIILGQGLLRLLFIFSAAQSAHNYSANRYVKYGKYILTTTAFVGIAGETVLFSYYQQTIFPLNYSPEETFKVFMVRVRLGFLQQSYGMLSGKMQTHEPLSRWISRMSKIEYFFDNIPIRFPIFPVSLKVEKIGVEPSRWYIERDDFFLQQRQKQNDQFITCSTRLEIVESSERIFLIDDDSSFRESPCWI